jgi:hypothetical protein
MRRRGSKEKEGGRRDLPLNKIFSGLPSIILLSISVGYNPKFGRSCVF